MEFPTLRKLCIKQIASCIMDEEWYTNYTPFNAADSREILKLMSHEYIEYLLFQMGGFQLKTAIIMCTNFTRPYAEFLSKHNLETLVFDGSNSKYFWEDFQDDCSELSELAFNEHTRNNLKVLTVEDGYRMIHKITEIVSWFKNLESLTLQWVPSDCFEMCFENFSPKWKFLDLSYGSVDLKALEILESLEMLKLCKMREVGDMTAVTRLPKLKFLNCSMINSYRYSEINPEFNPAFIGIVNALRNTAEDVIVFPELRVLDLSGTKLSQEDLEMVIKRMPKLEMVGLTGSSLHSTAIDNHPNVTFFNFANVQSITASLKFYYSNNWNENRQLVLAQIQKYGLPLQSPSDVKDFVDEILNQMERMVMREDEYRQYTEIVSFLWKNESIPILPRQTIQLVEIIKTCVRNFEGQNETDEEFWEILAIERILETEGVDLMDILIRAMDTFGRHEWNAYEPHIIIIEKILNLYSENSSRISDHPDKYRVVEEFYPIATDERTDKSCPHFTRKAGFLLKYIKITGFCRYLKIAELLETLATDEF